MTITIELPDTVESQVKTRAERAGISVSEYVARVLTGLVAQNPREKSFAEIFAPLQGGFEASGMSEEALNLFAEREVRAHRAERRAARS